MTKMSKSRGNALDPFKLIEEYGADTLRWYLAYVSPVWLQQSLILMV